MHLPPFFYQEQNIQFFPILNHCANCWRERSMNILFKSITLNTFINYLLTVKKWVIIILCEIYYFHVQQRTLCRYKGRGTKKKNLLSSCSLLKCILSSWPSCIWRQKRKLDLSIANQPFLHWSRAWQSL